MDDDNVSERLEQAAAGTTRRGALATLLGGALVLGGSADSEANRKAKRRKQRRRKISRTREITLSVSSISAGAVTLDYGYYDEQHGQLLCCAKLGSTTLYAGQNFTFSAPRTASDVQMNAWVWDREKYWFRFYNPAVGLPGVGIAVNGMLDHEESPYCCATLPWGQTVEYERGLKPGQTYSWNIENRAYCQVTRWADTATHKRFSLWLPDHIAAASDETD